MTSTGGPSLSAAYQRRGLESAIERSLRTAEVVVLEGARAVGKTTMLKQLEARGVFASYASLANRSTRTAAAADLGSWLAARRAPAIVDEAQLLADLPLALKELVDQRGQPGQFVLTGSASIGRTGLGGADPLTGRQVRLTLHPLTVVEANGISSRTAASLVDLMFDAEITTGPVSGWSRGELIDRMNRGGFPAHVLRAVRTTERELRDQVRADVESTLTGDVLEDERFDAFRAKVILDMLASNPGGILNLTRVSNQLGLDRRTVERYLDILRRRFLLHELPNLATRPQLQRASHPKVYPVDSAISAESLYRAGRPIAENPELAGQLLEAFVVNELQAHRGWAKTETDFFYWRDSSGRAAEVDLVIQDSTGRRVAIEVKAAAEVSPHDLRGIRTLQEAGAVHRGFLIYTGSEVIKMSEDVWALPVSFLDGQVIPVAERSAQPSLRANPSATLPVQVIDAGPVATIFVSYTHQDNDYDDGAILQFAKRLGAAYQFLYGDSLALFTDRDIRWGQEWAARLRTELESTTFLLAIVTPSYLRSRACQEEVLSFSAAAQIAGDERLLLPLIWSPIDDLDKRQDPVAKALSASQYVRAEGLRLTDPNSAEYRTEIEKIAARLHETVVKREHSMPHSAGIDLAPADQDDREDLLELFEAIETRQAPVVADVEHLKTALQGLTGAFADAEPAPPNPSPKSLRLWATRVAEHLDPAVQDLGDVVDNLKTHWSDFDEIASKLVIRSNEFPESQRAELRNQLTELAYALGGLGAGSEMAVVRDQMVAIGRLARQLRPLSLAFVGALDAVSQVSISATAWGESLA